jgi:hypothetical protein
MSHHTDCCDVCQKTIKELVQVLKRCIGVMEIAKVGEHHLADSYPLHAAKRLLAQIEGGQDDASHG